MRGFVVDIEKLSKDNQNFRRVLYTTKRSQLVVMSLKPGEEIGEEVHPDRDQFFRIEAGRGKAVIDGQGHELTDGSAVVVPAGARHNIINTSPEQELKFYTIYSPPEHRRQVIHPTKEDALRDTEHFDGEVDED